PSGSLESLLGKLEPDGKNSGNDPVGPRAGRVRVLSPSLERRKSLSEGLVSGSLPAFQDGLKRRSGLTSRDSDLAREDRPLSLGGARGRAPKNPSPGVGPPFFKKNGRASFFRVGASPRISFKTGS